jgi:hypothetical protein
LPKKHLFTTLFLPFPKTRKSKQDLLAMLVMPLLNRILRNLRHSVAYLYLASRVEVQVHRHSAGGWRPVPDLRDFGGNNGKALPVFVKQKYCFRKKVCTPLLFSGFELNIFKKGEQGNFCNPEKAKPETTISWQNPCQSFKPRTKISGTLALLQPSPATANSTRDAGCCFLSIFPQPLTKV